MPQAGRVKNDIRILGPRALGSAAGCREVDLIPRVSLAVAQVSYPEAALVESHSALPSSSWLSSVATAAPPGIPPSLCSSSLSTQQPQPASKTHPGPSLKPSQASSISGGSSFGGHLLTSPIRPLCQSHWTLGIFLAAVGVSEFGALCVCYFLSRQLPPHSA